MKPLALRPAESGADPLQQARLLRALRIMLAHPEDSQARRTLCQRGNTPAAPGGPRRQPGAGAQALHSPAGLAPAARP
jgi:hypothetical protein